jgi:hypothetical protein
MAAKNIADEKTDPSKLTKANPDFYKLIGAKGGKRTKETQGDAYFKSIAVVSHQPGKRSRGTAPAQPQGDPLGRPRRTPKRRAKPTPSAH